MEEIKQIQDKLRGGFIEQYNKITVDIFDILGKQFDTAWDEMLASLVEKKESLVRDIKERTDARVKLYADAKKEKDQYDQMVTIVARRKIELDNLKTEVANTEIQLGNLKKQVADIVNRDKVLTIREESNRKKEEDLDIKIVLLNDKERTLKRVYADLHNR